ncbi:MAG: hypothetical protein IPP90_16590 [Gemmatimonadaceae bacterium]|nr:hypothetical protein [Gemmatimonadaceae bacterium]
MRQVPPLLQLRRTYLLFRARRGVVVLIDQHSAHERVLYEQFIGTLERGESPAQRLLTPLTLHLGPDEAEAFDTNRAAFEGTGFRDQSLRWSFIAVQAVPRRTAFRCRTLSARNVGRAHR